MLIKIFSATTIGVDAYPVEVEVDLSFGMLQFHIVGLPDAAIKESRQRVATALKNCGIKLPERKITVNLAPADLKKEGTLFDLPIALGIICASQSLELDPKLLQESIFLGELSLDGSIKQVTGVLPIACDAVKMQKKRMFIPQANAQEASLIKHVDIYGLTHLTQLVSFLRGEITLEKTPPASLAQHEQELALLDFAQVKGQFQAKRTLQIAAAGRHNVLFIGSPGSGKTMLAQRALSIMPPMEFEEIVETSKIYSVSGKLGQAPLITTRPFRAPHHTISAPGLVGGGSIPQPGEISLAHNGILFLDELTEFKRSTLEVLRQPLENKSVCISRAQQSLNFPASFLLIAALNPCPCGFLGDKKRTCSCTPQSIARYLEKLSGPLLDRIDLQIKIPSLDYESIKSNSIPISSEELYAKVRVAVERQRARFKSSLMWNAYMTPDLIDTHCVLSPSAQELIKKAFDKLHLSMRGYHKLLKIARTIADLENAEIVEHNHVQEAIMYRSLDQSFEQKNA